MVFKIGSPGCSCCGLCACYAFDGNGIDSAGSRDLTATNPLYTAGKLNQAASFAGASDFNYSPQSTCFSPGANNTWRMWFWFRLDTVPTFDANGGHQGVITKSEIDYTPGSPATVALQGEWGVYWRTPSSGYTGAPTDSGTPLTFVYKSDSVATGLHHQAAIQKDVWYFFHWTLNKSDNNGTIYGKRSSDDGDAGTTDAFTGTMSTDPNFGLYVGKNTGTNGENLGQNSGGFAVDNVGFSAQSGSAALLYNSGKGKKCPYAGT